MHGRARNTDSHASKEQIVVDSRYSIYCTLRDETNCGSEVQILSANLTLLSIPKFMKYLRRAPSFLRAPRLVSPRMHL